MASRVKEDKALEERATMTCLHMPINRSSISDPCTFIMRIGVGDKKDGAAMGSPYCH